MSTAADGGWIWLDIQVLRAVHEEHLAEHGGSSGVRDEGLFESAIRRPMNLAAYGEPDAAALAAAYGFDLVHNHPFIDGNKRIAFVAVALFLRLNGWALQADDAQCVLTMLTLAAGEMTEDAYAQWLREHLQPRVESARQPNRLKLARSITARARTPLR